MTIEDDHTAMMSHAAFECTDAAITVELQEQSRGESNYRNAVRASARGLWSGVLDYDQAYDALWLGVEMGLTAAVHEGISECGIKPSEMSPQEKDMLREAIYSERSYINQLLADIENGSKEKGGKWGAFSGRLGLWISRYGSIKMKAAAMACGDRKKVWTLGPTKVHCPSCLKLAGKVKRNSYWLAHVLPQNFPNDKLECKGAGQCTLEDTDGPLSRGPLPNLP